MNETKKTDFEWFTSRGADIARMLSAPETKPLGAALASMLATRFGEVFPEELKRFRQAAEHRLTEQMKQSGPQLWETLHRRALLPVVDQAEEIRWLRGFAAAIPCGECRRFYQSYLAQFPPTLDDYFDWTVALHNLVNEKLGKPQVYPGEARQIWT